LGYWLYFVAPLVPLKAFIFADNKQQEQQQQEQQVLQPTQPQPQPASKLQQQQQQQQGMQSTQRQQQQQGLLSSGQNAALAATGCLAGFASGMLGIGGGTGGVDTDWGIRVMRNARWVWCTTWNSTSCYDRGQQEPQSACEALTQADSVTPNSTSRAPPVMPSGCSNPVPCCLVCVCVCCVAAVVTPLLALITQAPQQTVLVSVCLVDFCECSI
jgi:hypothetical protein